MKRWLPLLVLVLAAGWLASSLRPQKSTGAMDLVAFGRLPVLVNGRLKPIDTVARTSLLMLQGRQRVSDPTVPEPFVATPAEWLADVLFHPAKADTYPTFRLVQPTRPSCSRSWASPKRTPRSTTTARFCARWPSLTSCPAPAPRFSFKQLAPKLADTIARPEWRADRSTTPHQLPEGRRAAA